MLWKYCFAADVDVVVIRAIASGNNIGEAAVIIQFTTCSRGKYGERERDGEGSFIEMFANQ